MLPRLSRRSFFWRIAEPRSGRATRENLTDPPLPTLGGARFSLRI